LRENQWREACDLLHSTNNFPEITGRVCPAPCEVACAQRAGENGVPIRQIEYQIAECGFANDWVRPARIETETGKRVVVIGSGPAGMAAAQQLVRSGHEVIVFEKDDHVGGLLRYRIPDFKLSQTVLDRRLNQLREEGVRFVTGIIVGEDISHSYLCKMCDAICVAVETGPPKDLSVPGRRLENVVLGTEYLRQANMISVGEGMDLERFISVRGKIVAVIGGGDTGHDCVAVARRSGASRVYQFEIGPKQQKGLPGHMSRERIAESGEGDCIRRWGVHTKELSGSERKVNELRGIEVEWLDGQNGPQMHEIPGTEFSLTVDLVLLAIGFEHVSHSDIVERLGLRFDLDGNLVSDRKHITSQVGLFATSDAMMGTSLVGRAIASGRRVAAQIDQYLVGHAGRK
jgi:NAD(P)H-dependent glutamate synthase small subunit